MLLKGKAHNDEAEWLGIIKPFVGYKKCIIFV